MSDKLREEFEAEEFAEAVSGNGVDSLAFLHGIERTHGESDEQLSDRITKAVSLHAILI